MGGSGAPIHQTDNTGERGNRTKRESRRVENYSTNKRSLHTISP